MRGADITQESLFTIAKLDDYVPADHPLRPLRRLVDEALRHMNGLFSMIYAQGGRASIAPEKLKRAQLLQLFFSIRTTRYAGYAVSLKKRAWIESHFGWIKAAAGMRQVKQRGRQRVEALLQMAVAASNLIRLRGLLAVELSA